MSIESFIFYFFEGVAALSVIALITIRNVFYGALLLIVCLLALAGIYVLAFAEFIAVTQIMVYAGGVLVIILFAIMFTTKIAGKPLVVEHAHLLPGILVGGGSFFLIAYFVFKEPSFTGRPSQRMHNVGIHQIGFDLMHDFVLPFEMAGILLLMALIGAAVTASASKTKKE